MRYYNKQNYNGIDDDLGDERDRQAEQLPEVGQQPAGDLRVATGASSAPACGPSTRRPIATRSRPIRAPGSTRRCRTSTRCSARRRCSPTPSTSWRVAPKLTITPGIKYAYYKQDFTQFADNGKTVGNLNGAPSVEHVVDYHSWLPSIDAHCLVQPYWSMYAQYGKGQNIPPTSVFDVKNAQVGTLPKPMLTDTVPVRIGLEVAPGDARRRLLPHQLPERLLVDDRPVTGETLYFLNGESVTQGRRGREHDPRRRRPGRLPERHEGHARSTPTRPVGAERAERHRDDRPDLQPRQLERRLLQQARRPDVQRQRQHPQAVPIDPFNITNLLRQLHAAGSSRLSQSRIRLAVNNLTDSHAITAVTPASAKSNAADAGRRPDADGRPERVGRVHGRRQRETALS